MKKSRLAQIITYSIIILLILLILVLTFFPGIIYAWEDSSATTRDKCKPAQGYSEQEWEEHMGHHPDIYKECLT